MRTGARPPARTGVVIDGLKHGNRRHSATSHIGHHRFVTIVGHSHGLDVGSHAFLLRCQHAEHREARREPRAAWDKISSISWWGCSQPPGTWADAPRLTPSARHAGASVCRVKRTSKYDETQVTGANVCPLNVSHEPRLRTGPGGAKRPRARRIHRGSLRPSAVRLPLRIALAVSQSHVSARCVRDYGPARWTANIPTLVS